MPDLDKLIKDLGKLSESDLRYVLDALHRNVEQSEPSFEIIGINELDDGLAEKTKVIIMDKKMTRKVTIGEEGKQDEIIAEEEEHDPDHVS